MENITQKGVEKSKTNELILSDRGGDKRPDQTPSKILASFKDLPVTKKVQIIVFKQEEDKFFESCYSIIQGRTLPKAQRMLVGAYSKPSFLKLYEVANRKIEDLSSHKIVFPVKFHPDDLTVWFSGGPKKEIIFLPKKNQQQEEEMAEGEKAGKDTLVFRCKFGHAKDYELHAEYFGKIKEGYQGFFDFRFRMSFEIYQMFKSTERLYLMTATYKPNGQEEGVEKQFLATLSKHNKNMVKFILDLSFDFSKSKIYQERLKEKTLEAELKNILHFKPKLKIRLEDFTSMPDQRYSSFCHFDSQMITAGVIDLRNKKIVTKSFVSIFEIFKALGFTSIYHCKKMIIQRSLYSPQQDALYLNILINFALLNNRNEEHRQIYLQEVLKDRSVDDYPRVLMRRWDSTPLFKKYFVRVTNLRQDKKKRIYEFLQNKDFSRFIPTREGKIISSWESKDSLDVVVYGGHKVKKGSEKNFNIHDDESSGGSPFQGMRIEIKDSLSFPKNQIFEDPVEKPYGFNYILNVDEKTFLVDSSKKFLLFDKESKKLVDSQTFSDNFHPYLEGVKVDQDIVVSLVSWKGIIDIYQIHPDFKSEEEESFRLDKIDFIDLENKPDIFAVREILGVKKNPGKGTVEIFLAAECYANHYQSEVRDCYLVAVKQLFDETNEMKSTQLQKPYGYEKQILDLNGWEIRNLGFEIQPYYRFGSFSIKGDFFISISKTVRNR